MAVSSRAADSLLSSGRRRPALRVFFVLVLAVIFPSHVSARRTALHGGRVDGNPMTFSSAMLDVTAGEESPLRVVPAGVQWNVANGTEAEAAPYPRTTYEVCLQIDVPTAVPLMSLALGIIGSLETSEDVVSSASPFSTSPPPKVPPTVPLGKGRGFRGVTGSISFAVEGDLFFGKLTLILEGKVSISSPNAASHKDLISAFGRAICIKLFGGSTTLNGNSLSTLSGLSEAAAKERELVMQSLEDISDMRPGPSGQLDATQINKAAAAFDVMRAASEACVERARSKLFRTLMEGEEKATLADEIYRFDFDKKTWRQRVEKFRGFGEPRRWWQLWPKAIQPPSKDKWETWSVLAAQAQLQILAFVKRADACVMDDVFARDTAKPTHGDECANLPPSRSIDLDPEIEALLSEETKAMLSSTDRFGGSAGALPEAVTVFPQLMCMMLRAAPDTEWLSDAAEATRMADADAQTEVDRAARAARVRESGMPDPLEGAAASAAARDFAPLGDGRSWEGTTPGSTSDAQMEAIRKCREKLSKGGHSKEMEDGTFTLPPGLDSLPEECAIFAKTGPSRELLDRDDEAREEGLLHGTALNGQRAEFSNKMLWSRTFPDINSVSNSPCSAAQLDPMSTTPPSWCFVRISHASSELLFPLMRDLRFAFNNFAQEIRKAQASESSTPDAKKYRRVTQYVHKFTLDALKRYEEPGWTLSSLVERGALHPLDASGHPVRPATPHATSVYLGDTGRSSALHEIGRSSRHLPVWNEEDEDDAEAADDDFDADDDVGAGAAAEIDDDVGADAGIEDGVLDPGPEVPTSFLEMAGRVEAGSRLRTRARSTISASATHKVGAAHGGWLLEPLADMLSALETRLKDQATEMASIPFGMTVEYHATLTMYVTVGVTEVDFCTPYTNTFQLRGATGYKETLDITSTVAAVGDGEEKPLTHYTPTNSSTTWALEVSFYPNSYLGVSILYEHSFHYAKQTRRPWTLSSLNPLAERTKVEQHQLMAGGDKNEVSIMFGLTVLLSMSDLMKERRAGGGITDNELAVAGALAAGIAREAISQFASLACKNIPSCKRHFSQKGKEAEEAPEVSADELSKASKTGKPQGKMLKNWRSFVGNAVGGLLAADNWSGYGGSEDRSAIVLQISIGKRLRQGSELPFLELSATLNVRTQFKMPLGFKQTGGVTMHALRGKTYDLKDFIHMSPVEAS